MLIKFLSHHNLDSPIITSIPNASPISACLPTLAVKCGGTSLADLEKMHFYLVKSLKAPHPTSSIPISASINDLSLSFGSVILFTEEVYNVPSILNPSSTSSDPTPASKPLRPLHHPTPSTSSSSPTKPRTHSPHISPSSPSLKHTQTQPPPTMISASVDVDFSCPLCLQRQSYQDQMLDISTQTLPQIKSKKASEIVHQFSQTNVPPIQCSTDCQTDDVAFADVLDSDLESDCAHYSVSLSDFLPLPSPKQSYKTVNDVIGNVSNGSRMVSQMEIKPKSITPRKVSKFNVVSWKVSIKPLPLSLRDESVLLRAFTSFGGVLACKVYRKLEFFEGEVLYANQSSAVEAQKSLDGFRMEDGTCIRLTVDKVVETR
ncbi:hypothetical protein GEMRC1_013935 [Eukaryota sp. GEM-RC1]